MRLELGAEFDTTKQNASEVRSLVLELQAQKQNMIYFVDKQFKEFQEKSGEMKTLIGQSDAVLLETRSVVDGVIRSLNVRFEQDDQVFREIYSKHATYDDIVSRRPPQGKGTSAGVWQESKIGLIHEKDIKMHFVPEKCDNTETFRRWWKGVAEYCERSPRFPYCILVFKKIRGYQQRIDGHDYIEFSTAFNLSLPQHQAYIYWEFTIADKEFLSALKHVMQGKHSDVVNQLTSDERGFELLRLLALKFAQSCRISPRC